MQNACQALVLGALVATVPGQDPSADAVDALFSRRAAQYRAAARSLIAAGAAVVPELSRRFTAALPAASDGGGHGEPVRRAEPNDDPFFGDPRWFTLDRLLPCSWSLLLLQPADEAAADADVAGPRQRRRATPADTVLLRTAFVLGRIGAPAAPAIPALRRGLGHGDVDVAGACAQALVAIGEPALPALLASLSSPAQGWAGASALAVMGDAAMHGVIEELRANRSRTRRRALLAIAIAGGSAASAVDDLIALLRRGTALVDVTWTLGRIGEPAVAPLLQVVRTETSRARTYAIAALGLNGPVAAAAIGPLLDLLEGGELAAPYAIAGGNDVVDELQWLAEALPRLQPRGRSAERAATALIRRYDGAGVSARLAILSSLGRLPDGARVSVPFLAQQLTSADDATRCVAVHALAIGAADDAALFEAIRQRLTDDPSLAVRREAARVLGLFGPPATPVLVPLLADEDLGDWALAGVRAIGPPALPALLAAPENEAATMLICGGLAALGEAALPALLDCVRNDDTERWRRAALALAWTRAPVLPEVLALLAADQPRHRQRAVTILEQLIGTDPGRDDVPLLADALQRNDAAARRALVELLRRAPPDLAFAPLTAALADDDAEVRRCAARALDEQAEHR